MEWKKISNIQNEQNTFWSDFSIKGVVPKPKRGGANTETTTKMYFL